MELRNLKPLVLIVSAMVVIDASFALAVALTVTFTPDFFAATIAPIANAYDATERLFSIATMIVFGVWIYQAGRNLVEAGYEDISFSPGERIWWFAVPLANFVIPYQGMRELWNASHGNSDREETIPLVSMWWGLWLLNRVVITLIQFMSEGGTTLSILWLVALSNVALAGAAIIMINRITDAQSKLGAGGIGDVFA